MCDQVWSHVIISAPARSTYTSNNRRISLEKIKEKEALCLTLYEVGRSACDWQGDIDFLVKFLLLRLWLRTC